MTRLGKNVEITVLKLMKNQDVKEVHWPQGSVHNDTLVVLTFHSIGVYESHQMSFSNNVINNGN